MPLHPSACQSSTCHQHSCPGHVDTCSPTLGLGLTRPVPEAVFCIGQSEWQGWPWLGLTSAPWYTGGCSACQLGSVSSSPITPAPGTPYAVQEDLALKPGRTPDLEGTQCSLTGPRIHGRAHWQGIHAVLVHRKEVALCCWKLGEGVVSVESGVAL